VANSEGEPHGTNEIVNISRYRFERLLELYRPPVTEIEDVLDPETRVTFALSERFCNEICKEIVYCSESERPVLGGEHRQAVMYTPTVVRRYSEATSRDTHSIGALWYSPFTLRRSQDTFQSWTVTEKVEAPKVRALSRRSLHHDPSTLLATLGLAEEIYIRPDPCIIQVPQRSGPAKHVLAEDFYIEYLPLGVIFNFSREGAPIAPVVLIVTNGLLASRESLAGECFPTFSSLPVLFGDMTERRNVDSWARIVASACLDNYPSINSIRGERLDTYGYFVMEGLYRDEILAEVGGMG
jgi:hypothetical protein